MPTTTDAAALVERLQQRLAPLEHTLQLAYWEVAADARPETAAAKASAEEAWLAALADPALLAEVEAALAGADGAAEPLTARALAKARLELLANQIPERLRPALVRLQARAEATFYTTRGRIGDRELANSELDEILAKSNDAQERRAAWEASKQVGAAVRDDLLALVELRNSAARERGARDWFQFALATNDLDERRLDQTLDEVEAATREPFLAAKAALDARLAARFGVSAGALRPWHYGDPFFQRLDAGGDQDASLDPLLHGRDQVQLTVAAYDSMGLETRHILARSDLHPRPGKDQHAFCIAIDRAGDVRVLANLAPGEASLDTLLHELGHGVYDDRISPGLPWLLRCPPHSLSTEAVALMLGRLRRDPDFLTRILGAGTGQAAALARRSQELLRDERLVFTRWCMVMVRFEQALYRDPAADLSGIWWDLVERLQDLHRPDGRDRPDWAAKIHLAVSPVYYQNYLLGELMAAQLDAAVRDAAGGFIGRPEAGTFLTERVFAPGASPTWSGLVEAATGRPLGVAALLHDPASR
jgi:peptidyl-dipeptidase A